MLKLVFVKERGSCVSSSLRRKKGNGSREVNNEVLCRVYIHRVHRSKKDSRWLWVSEQVSRVEYRMCLEGRQAGGQVEQPPLCKLIQQEERGITGCVDSAASLSATFWVAWVDSLSHSCSWVLMMSSGCIYAPKGEPFLTGSFCDIGSLEEPTPAQDFLPWISSTDLWPLFLSAPSLSIAFS